MPEENAESEATVYTNDGIYVLRTTQQNQVQLNLMADQKANIVIGMSLIFFTIAHRIMTGGDSTPDWVILPVLILSVSMTAAFLLAVLVLIPKLRHEKKCEANTLANPLFFSLFASAEVDDFASYLVSELEDPRRARELLARDVHSTGVALRKKFTLLRFAYICLTVGVLATILSILLLRTG